LTNTQKYSFQSATLLKASNSRLGWWWNITKRDLNNIRNDKHKTTERCGQN